MKFSIEEALQHGIAAHREGRLEEAEQFYNAILVESPNHPDANHNLGVLTLYLGRGDDALPLLENALRSDQSATQYWLSYIEALLALKRNDKAETACGQALRAGVAEQRLIMFRQKFSASSASTGDAQLADADLAPAVRFRDSGDYYEAEDWLRSFCNKSPNDARALSLLSQILLLNNQAEEAEELLLRATGIDPDLLSVLQNQARLLLKKASVEEALKTAELAYGKSKDSESMLVLAACLAAAGRDPEAITLIERVIDMAPNSAEAFASRAMIKYRMSDLTGALKDAEYALSIKPFLTQLSQLVASVYLKSNNISSALAVLESASECRSDNIDIKIALGDVYRMSGDQNRAIAVLEQVTSQAPENTNAWINLGAVHQQLKNSEKARKCYRTALCLNSELAEVANNLGVLAKEEEDWDSAKSYFESAVITNPNLAEAHSNLGITLQNLGFWDASEAAHRRAVGLKPGLASTHFNLGSILQIKGELTAARVCYEKALDLKNDFAEAHRHLTKVKFYKSRDEQYEQMKRIFSDEGRDVEQHCQAAFGLAKANEDLGDYEQAFRYYRAGNTLRRKALKYDLDEDISLFQAIKSSYPAIERYALRADESGTEFTPIFILGMPRSGTTLVEQIVSSHSQVYGGGELLFAKTLGEDLACGRASINGATLRAFRNSYLSALKVQSNAASFATDKLPHNFLYLGLICAAIPEAVVIHVARDKAAVCWANYRQYFETKALGFTYSLSDTIGYYTAYESLMGSWKKHFPDRIFDLNYEELTISPEKEIFKLITHIGLEWEAACLAPQDNSRSVATASGVEVREKIYQRSSEQWKRYKQFLNGALDNI